jgi:ABC-2 type transport system ATP-binding protein
MLELTHVGKEFRGIAAVSQLSLRVGGGEVVGLLGPNGAGKTTTLRMIVGLTAPDQGRVELLGIGSPRHAQVRRHIGYAPQALCAYEELTARENVALSAGLAGVGRRALGEAVRASLARVNLLPRADERVSGYSVGMQRRLMLACAIAHGPRLLVLDEPTAGVDPHSREAIFDIVRSLRADGVGVLYTTHLMEEAELLCDRVAILDRGLLIAEGSLPSLLAHRPLRTPKSVSVPQAPPTGLHALFMELTGRELREP